MLKAVFTLDYEIHGNGDGCPYALMIEPTDRLLRQFDQYGAKLTVMADVGEILKFKEYAKQHGRDDYHYAKIVDQLRDAVRRGHDVQLHMHSSYFNARHEGGRWRQDWSEYDFAVLKPRRIQELLARGKEYLEKILRPVAPNYRCFVFRSGNWAVSPSRNVVDGLVATGFAIDTSVFKYGWRKGLVNFDYSEAYSNLIPWRVSGDNICARDAQGALFEFPIYAENRWIGAFLTAQRLYRICMSRLHRVRLNGAASKASRNGAPLKTRVSNGATRLCSKHAWKADFNQCSGGQLIRALERASARCSDATVDLPFVLIGHSKLFTHFNGRSLRRFLSYVAENPQRVGFGKFGDFDLQRLDRYPAVAEIGAATKPAGFAASGLIRASQSKAN